MNPLEHPAPGVWIAVLVAHLLGESSPGCRWAGGAVGAGVGGGVGLGLGGGGGSGAATGCTPGFARPALRRAALTGALALPAVWGGMAAWNGSALRAVAMAIAVGLAHAAIARLTRVFVGPVAVSLAPRRPVARWVGILTVDQALHLFVLAWAVALATGAGRSGWSPWWAGASATEGELVIALGVLGFLAAVPGGALVIGRAIEPFQTQIELRASRAGVRAGGLRDGGTAIGLLERAVVFLMVVIETPSGVGFLIAAKSIFRFGELKDRSNRMEAEYFLIGTLMSVAWALGVGEATRAAISRTLP